MLQGPGGRRRQDQVGLEISALVWFVRDGFGKPDPKNKWAGWLNSVDAVSGMQRWRFKAPDPIIGCITPTAGQVVFCGDMGGNFYVQDSASGTLLWKRALGGAVSGRVITYDSGVGQKVAVSTGGSKRFAPLLPATSLFMLVGMAPGSEPMKMIRPSSLSRPLPHACWRSRPSAR